MIVSMQAILRQRSQYLDNTKSFPEKKVNILEGYSIGHSKQKSVYVHVSYSERFPI
jgi:hypothetical protein